MNDYFGPYALNEQGVGCLPTVQASSSGAGNTNNTHSTHPSPDSRSSVANLTQIFATLPDNPPETPFALPSPLSSAPTLPDPVHEEGPPPIVANGLYRCWHVSSAPPSRAASVSGDGRTGFPWGVLGRLPGFVSAKSDPGPQIPTPQEGHASSTTGTSSSSAGSPSTKPSLWTRIKNKFRLRDRRRSFVSAGPIHARPYKFSQVDIQFSIDPDVRLSGESPEPMLSDIQSACATWGSVPPSATYVQAMLNARLMKFASRKLRKKEESSAAVTEARPDGPSTLGPALDKEGSTDSPKRSQELQE